MEKPFYKKWWFWVIVVVLVVMLGSCSSGGSDDGSKSNQNNSTVGQAENTNKVTEPTKDTYTVGDVIELEDGILTIESCNILNGGEYNQPESGKEFVEVVFLFENTSDRETTISSWLGFAAYVDGFSIDEDFSARLATENDSFGGTVAAGKKLRGSLCYQVPSDWSELEIQFGDNIWKDKDVAIVITNNK